MLSNVSVQGPYEISSDGQRVLFPSPRSGNFDIYVADTGISGGLEALQSSRTTADIAPGVPTPVPEPAQTSSRAVVATDAAGSTIAHPQPAAAVAGAPAPATVAAPAAA